MCVNQEVFCDAEANRTEYLNLFFEISASNGRNSIRTWNDVETQLLINNIIAELHNYLSAKIARDDVRRAISHYSKVRYNASN